MKEIPDYNSIPLEGRPIDAIPGNETAHVTVQVGVVPVAPNEPQEEEQEEAEEEHEDGNSMTKAELKAALDEAGIDYPSDALKADLVELYEQIPEA